MKIRISAVISYERGKKRNKRVTLNSDEEKDEILKSPFGDNPRYKKP